MLAIDPITLEVVRGSLVATALQMRATLIRTAYAPIIYETLDFSCGLLTAEGELAAMSEDFSGHVFAMALGLKDTQAKFADDIHPGDVIAVNDPYTGGTHMNDTAFYTPFFFDGDILLFIGVRAHWADVGGATPGSFSGQDTEIYQEGMRIVPVKIVERGKRNQGLWDVLFANMRGQEEREGDALAMLDTARVAEMRIGELCHKYGGDTIRQCLKVLLDSAEETMRERVRELPDGECYYEQYMDNSGLSPEPLPIKGKLTVEGDSMTFDFTGSAPQVVGPMNCGLPVTQGGVFVVAKSWLDPKTPVNGGTFRPVRFVIPEGSCLAAQLPAAVGGCWEVYRQMESCVVGLISQIMPHEPGGETTGTTNHVYVAGYDPVRGRSYILYEYPMGGTPATVDTDGATGTFGYDCGEMACVYPAESAEQRQPLLIEGLEAQPGGEGAGFRRSGFGVIRRVRVLVEGSQLNVMSDRSVIPPWGALGAPAGTVNSVTVLRDGRELDPSPLPGKVKSFPLKPGDVVVMKGSAGGGVGDALSRELERVGKDVLEGYVSMERARDVYGVVFENGSPDPVRTERLREKLRSQRFYLRIVEATADEFDDRGCRVGVISREAAARIGVVDGDMMEHISDAPAPIRSWARVDEGLASDELPLGPIGQSILQVVPGDEVWVRRLQIRTVDASQP